MQEGGQFGLGIAGLSNRIVGQDEFTQLRTEAGCARLDAGLTEAVRFGVGIAVEDRLGGGDPARPEAGARFLMAIGFAGDAVGETGDVAGMRRCLAAGKAGDGEVETTPEEMNRAGLAEE